MRKISKIFMLIVLFVFHHNAFAVTHLENWNFAIITGSITKDKKLRYYIQPGLSFEDDESKYRSSNLYLGMGIQLNHDMALWMMNGFHNRIQASGDMINRNTIRQEFDWAIITNGPVLLTNTTRLEERVQYGESEWSFRLRQRFLVRVPLPFWQTHSFVTFDEAFFNLNYPSWINTKSALDQNQAFIGLGTRLSQYVSFDLGYLNQYELRSNGNQVNNVIYLMFNVTLE